LNELYETESQFKLKQVDINVAFTTKT